MLVLPLLVGTASADPLILDGWTPDPTVGAELGPISPTPPDLEVMGIVNGTNASNGQYENTVALYQNSYGNYCSGTLIDPEWVVTAGHCVEGISGLPSIHFGNNAYAPLEVRSTVEKIVHPGFDYASGDLDDDIALLHLGSRMNTITPATLNIEAVGSSWIGDELTFVGFGITGDTDYYSGGTKRFTTVPVYTWDSSFVISLDESPPITNVCSGDSGGSAFESGPEGLELAGVNSFVWSYYGAPCETGGNGATRIDAYVDWILGYVPNAALSNGEGGATGTTTEPGPDPDPVDTGFEVAEDGPDRSFNDPLRPTATQYPSRLGGCAQAPSVPFTLASLTALVLVARRRRA